MRADRQPEFTQVDLEMAYVNNCDQVGVVVEDLIHNVWNRIRNISTYRVNEQGYLEAIDFDSTKPNSSLHFGKLKYIDALCKYGIDKPDLRSKLEFVNLSELFIPSSTNNGQFPVLEACILKKAFEPSKGKYKLPRSLIDPLSYTCLLYTSRCV